MVANTPRLVVETLSVVVVTALVLVTAFQFGAVDPPTDQGVPATPTPDTAVAGTPPPDEETGPLTERPERERVTPASDGGGTSTPAPGGGGVAPTPDPNDEDAPTLEPDDERSPSPDSSRRSTPPRADGGASGGAGPSRSVPTPSAEPAPTPSVVPTPVPEPAFSFELVDVVDCGLTCRTVTSTLENDGSGSAEDVTVEVTIYAGSRRVWRGTEAVGSLSPGQSYTVERDVDVGLGGAAAIQANDGVVEVVTVVSHADGVERFSGRYDVL